jgi:hypothetical protein
MVNGRATRVHNRGNQDGEKELMGGRKLDVMRSGRVLGLGGGWWWVRGRTRGSGAESW